MNSYLDPGTKHVSSSRSTGFKDILLQIISLVIKKTAPITTKIITSCAMKRSPWKLRQQNQNFSMERTPLQNKY